MRSAKKTFLAVLLFMGLAVLSACSSQEAEVGSSSSSQAAAPSQSQVAETQITLSQNGVDIQGTGAAALVDGTVNITAGGVYRLTGTLEGGVVVQAAGQTVELVLDNAQIHNPDGPAILFQEGEEALITLTSGSVNSLSDGGESQYDGALYSVPSLTISGEGALTVEGNVEEGIATEMHLTVNGGQLAVTSQDDGFNANNDGVSTITINGGDVWISAGGDGIDSNGSITINGGRILTMSVTSDMSGGLDCDGELMINGGVVMATGASNTMPSQESPQKSVVMNLSGVQSAGTLVEVYQGENLLAAFAPAREYSQVLYSAPDLADDTDYTMLTGGSGSGEDASLPGVYEEAQGGQEQGTVTTESVTQTLGMGPGGGRGPEGGRPPEMPEGGEGRGPAPDGQGEGGEPPAPPPEQEQKE